jgi:hypothetical protein
VSTDLYLHIAVGVTAADLTIQRCHTVGSRSFAPRTYPWEARRAVYEKLLQTPACWIGERVWAPRTAPSPLAPFVYDPVARIAALLGDGVTILDEDIRTQILAALVLSTRTDGALATPAEVREFLHTYRGQPVCAVYW